MPIFKKVIEFLNKPFPQGENRSWYYGAMSFLSLFVVVFLYIFKPFGIHRLPTNPFLMCLGFGAMTFLGAALYEISIHQLRSFKKTYKNYTFGTWSLNNLGVMFCISLANFVFARLVYFGYFEWSLFPTMLYATFMIGIIPLTMIGGFVLLTQEKKNQNTTTEINPSGDYSKGESIFLFEIPLHQVKYIEALQNYVKIAYINTEGQLKIQTERVTLKEIQAKIEGGPVVKCHRSYLVNTNYIIDYKGNSQGLLLTLSDCNKVIPVSRTWVPLFRKS
ncbi:LytTR family transcriptional regulator [Maribacter algarum]|uniref:LytTR family transcriptional regulator n=1 Tax=Maribacter algarum (ex Zhang et al. 2020) TaxID=2578118 RepID=A0A5S3PQ67_9FLAO|nr:LytTR family DNA-binding domain-containing protein [Maribacter algarum]TMM56801.1 LytTR family transcriptional regulator [Maribacter algarum]